MKTKITALKDFKFKEELIKKGSSKTLDISKELCKSALENGIFEVVEVVKEDIKTVTKETKGKKIVE